MKFVYIGDYVFSQQDFKQVFESFIENLFAHKRNEDLKRYSNPIIYIGGHSEYVKKAKGNILLNRKKLAFRARSFFQQMELEIPLESVRDIEIKKGNELESSSSPVFQYISNAVKDQVKYLVICYSGSLNKEQYLIFEITRRAENELADLPTIVKDVKKKEEKLEQQFESISRDNLRNLEFSLVGYLGGFRASPYGVGDAVIGIVDPTYGIYRQTLQRRIEEGQKSTTSNYVLLIEKYYTQYPKIVRAYLDDVASRLKETMANGNISQRDVVFKKKVLDLIRQISRKCSSCSEKIPREAKTCPYCKSEVSIVSEKKEDEDDPLRILKLRLAKGEISKEQYNDLKKMLES